MFFILFQVLDHLTKYFIIWRTQNVQCVAISGCHTNHRDTSLWCQYRIGRTQVEKTKECNNVTSHVCSRFIEPVHAKQTVTWISATKCDAFYIIGNRYCSVKENNWREGEIRQKAGWGFKALRYKHFSVNSYRHDYNKTIICQLCWLL